MLSTLSYPTGLGTSKWVRNLVDAALGEQAMDLICRDAEAGVAHAQRLEQARAQERLERLTGRSRDEHAQHACAGVVHPSFTGLVHQRQAAQAAPPFVWRRHRPRRPHANVQLGSRLEDGISIGRREHLPETHTEGQQVAYGAGILHLPDVLSGPFRTGLPSAALVAGIMATNLAVGIASALAIARSYRADQPARIGRERWTVAENDGDSGLRLTGDSTHTTPIRSRS